jgi:cell division protein FtsW (lipid II flippase)
MKSTENVDMDTYTKVYEICKYVGSILILVLGALMISESITSTFANRSFMFHYGINRSFEFVVGLIAMVLSATMTDVKVIEERTLTR